MAWWVSAYIAIVILYTVVVKSGCCTFAEHVRRNENLFSLLRASLLDKGSLKSLCEIEQDHMTIVAQTPMVLKFLSVLTNVSACDERK